MTQISDQPIYPRYYHHPVNLATGFVDAVLALPLPRRKRDMLLAASRVYAVEAEGEPPLVMPAGIAMLPLPSPLQMCYSGLFDSEDDLISHGFVLRGSS